MRQTGMQSGKTFYDWLMKNNFPQGFQTLCWNCNFAKHKFGECPCQKGFIPPAVATVSPPSIMS